MVHSDVKGGWGVASKLVSSAEGDEMKAADTLTCLSVL